MMKYFVTLFFISFSLFSSQNLDGLQYKKPFKFLGYDNKWRISVYKQEQTVAEIIFELRKFAKDSGIANHWWIQELYVNKDYIDTGIEAPIMSQAMNIMRQIGENVELVRTDTFISEPEYPLLKKYGFVDENPKTVRYKVLSRFLSDLDKTL